MKPEYSVICNKSRILNNVNTMRIFLNDYKIYIDHGFMHRMSYQLN